MDVANDAMVIKPGGPQALILDARLVGLNATSAAGRALVVETVSGTTRELRRIRIEGLMAQGGTAGPLISISNVGPLALADVVVRDAYLSCRTPASAGPAPTAVVVSNDATGVNGTMTDILFNNLVIRSAQTDRDGDVVRITASNSNGIDGFSWQGGSIGLAVPPTTTMTKVFNRRYVVLSNTRNAFFKGLGFDQSDHVTPVVIGDGTECQNVVFSDVAITRVAATTPTVETTAVTFDKAIRCGWVRGGIGGARLNDTSYVAFTAVKMTANASRCFVEDADLANNGSASDPVSVLTSAAYRLTGNFGSARRSAIGLGPAISTPVAGGQYGGTFTPRSGLVALEQTTAVVRQINAETMQAGDLLIVTALGNTTVTISEPNTTPLFGNVLLSAPTIVLEGSKFDTLTLLYRGKDGNGLDLGWVQVARSDNG